MVTWTPAVDSSYDYLTLNEAGCFRTQGISLFIQGLWTAAEAPPFARHNILTAQRTGLDIAAYISINGTQNGAWHVDRGRHVLGNEWNDLLFVAIDVELPGIAVNRIWEAINRTRELGQTPIIYTSYNAWHSLVWPRNPSDFSRAGIPLWNAYWDESNDVDFAYLPYGSWTPDQVWIEQWSGGTYVCGQYVDRNTAAADRITGGDTLASGEYEELVRANQQQNLVMTYLGKQIRDLKGSVEFLAKVVVELDHRTRES